MARKAFARRELSKPAERRPPGFVPATIEDAFFEALPAEGIAAWGETAH
jgi:hypothetical protein